MERKSRTVKKFFIMTAVILLATGVVWAQEQTLAVHTLDEILVTATHETRVIDTPSSISIITGDELVEMGAKDITEALSKIPGLIIPARKVHRSPFAETAVPWPADRSFSSTVFPRK